jgi:hypothetical protein
LDSHWIHFGFSLDSFEYNIYSKESTMDSPRIRADSSWILYKNYNENYNKF